MKDICHKCNREFELHSETKVSGLCDACRSEENEIRKEDGVNVAPYKPGPQINARKAHVRETDLPNGAHIKLARFVEKGSDGDYGIALTYLSPEKDGRRTRLAFSLSDSAAFATCQMLSEFFGVCGAA